MQWLNDAISAYAKQQFLHMVKTSAEQASGCAKQTFYAIFLLNMCAACLLGLLVAAAIMLLQAEGFTVIQSIALAASGLLAVMIGCVISIRHSMKKVKAIVPFLHVNTDDVAASTFSAAGSKPKPFGTMMQDVAIGSLWAFVDGFMDNSHKHDKHGSDIVKDDNITSEEYHTLELVKNTTNNN